MLLGFILPSESERRKIGAAQEAVYEMRADQIKHLEHLLRSWRVFGTSGGIVATWRAIKRTLRDRP